MLSELISLGGNLLSQTAFQQQTDGSGGGDLHSKNRGCVPPIVVGGRHGVVFVHVFAVNRTPRDIESIGHNADMGFISNEQHRSFIRQRGHMDVL
jgi:hypothetical protein